MSGSLRRILPDRLIGASVRARLSVVRRGFAPMTEFTKLKITFALALLGTLFALHPLLDRFADWGFLYLGYDLKVFYAYSLTSGLLSLCVYLYAVTLLNDRPHSWCERTGNSTYALAILVVPIYAGLYLSAKLAERVAVSHLAWAAPVVALGLGAGGSHCRRLWPGGSGAGSASRTACPR